MKEINPALSTRAYAFEMWMKAPMPMVTLIKTIDITNLRRINRRKGLKLNMLMCWCIGKAASQIDEFYTLPVENKLIRYDSLAVNTIVTNSNNEISSCDIPFSQDLAEFNANYLHLTQYTAKTCTNHDMDDSMVIGTSALIQCKIDGAIGMYSGIFNNPFLIWGRYTKRWIKTHLKVSFQFHHTQMDGANATRFLHLLQNEINNLRIGK